MPRRATRGPLDRIPAIEFFGTGIRQLAVQEFARLAQYLIPVLVQRVRDRRRILAADLREWAAMIAKARFGGASYSRKRWGTARLARARRDRDKWLRAASLVASLESALLATKRGFRSEAVARQEYEAALGRVWLLTETPEGLHALGLSERTFRLTESGLRERNSALARSAACILANRFRLGLPRRFTRTPARLVASHILKCSQRTLSRWLAGVRSLARVEAQLVSPSLQRVFTDVAIQSHSENLKRQYPSGFRS